VSQVGRQAGLSSLRNLGVCNHSHAVHCSNTQVTRRGIPYPSCEASENALVAHL
jgi:hypothetical protein